MVWKFVSRRVMGFQRVLSQVRVISSATLGTGPIGAANVTRSVTSSQPLFCHVTNGLPPSGLTYFSRRNTRGAAWYSIWRIITARRFNSFRLSPGLGKSDEKWLPWRHTDPDVTHINGVGLNPTELGGPSTMRTTRQLSITLPNDMADVLRDKVSAGDYASESEVIREGLRALFARDRAVEAWLQTEVATAYDAAIEDTSRTVSAQALRDRLAAEQARSV